MELKITNNFNRFCFKAKKTPIPMDNKPQNNNNGLNNSISRDNNGTYFINKNCKAIFGTTVKITVTLKGELS